MKIKITYTNGNYEQFNLGYCDIDSGDLKDLDFRNAEPENLYFYNLNYKLTETGLCKVIAVVPEFNASIHDVYIVPEKDLTDEQQEFKSKKRFLADMLEDDNLTKDVILNAGFRQDELVIDKLKPNCSTYPFSEAVIYKYKYSSYIDKVCISEKYNVSTMQYDYLVNIKKLEGCEWVPVCVNATIHTISQFNTLMNIFNVNKQIIK